MDFISVYIAIIVIAFFASNYFYKYKEDNYVKDYIGVSVYFSFFLQIFLIIGIINDVQIVSFISLVLISSILLIQIIFSVKKINLFTENKQNPKGYVCAIISVRNIFYILGSLLIVFEHILKLVNIKLFKK